MAGTGDQGHRFGGAWTEVKLDAVSHYCQFFNKVLVGKPTPSRPFERWYFDAFAGSGTRQVDHEAGGLLEGRPIEIATQDMAGSVLNALQVDPPFHKLAFIEGHRGRFRSLEKIKAAHPAVATVQPATGFHVTSVHSIFDIWDIGWIPALSEHRKTIAGTDPAVSSFLRRKLAKVSLR